MKKKLSLWAFLSLILVTMTICIFSIFYYVTIHQSYRMVRVQEEKILKILVMLYREIHKLYKHSKIITIIKVSKNKCYSLAKNQI